MACSVLREYTRDKFLFVSEHLQSIEYDARNVTARKKSRITKKNFMKITIKTLHVLFIFLIYILVFSYNKKKKKKDFCPVMHWK